MTIEVVFPSKEVLVGRKLFILGAPQLILKGALVMVHIGVVGQVIPTAGSEMLQVQKVQVGCW